jgi:hypothetical protein
MTTQADQADFTAQPVYWFVILEEARSKGDFELAAKAQRELGRLGVRVRYGHSAKTTKARGA